MSTTPKPLKAPPAPSSPPRKLASSSRDRFAVHKAIESTSPKRKTAKSLPNDKSVRSSHVQISSLLSFLEQAEKETVEEEEPSPVSPATVHPIQETAQVGDVVVRAYADLKSKLLAMSVELEVGLATVVRFDVWQTKTKMIAALKSALNRSKDAVASLEERYKQDTTALEEMSKKSTKDAIARHLALVKQLLADKEDLTKKCEQLVERIQKTDTSFEHNVKALKERHSIELLRLRERMEEDEKSRKEVWITEKTKAIKQMTIKGLEPELQRMMEQHKEALREKDEQHHLELSRLRSQLSQDKQDLLHSMKDQFSRDRDDVINRERETFDQRLAQLRMKHDQDIDTLRTRWMQKVEKERSSAEDSIRKLRKAHEEVQCEVSPFFTFLQDLELIKQQHGREIQMRSDQQKQLQSEMSGKIAKEVELMKQREQFSRKQWEITTAAEFKAAAEKAEEDLRQRLTEERDKQLELVIGRLTAEATVEKRRLKQEWKDRLDEIESKHGQDLRSVRSNESGWVDKYSALATTHKSLEQELRQARARIEQLSGKLEEKETAIMNLEDALRAMERTEDQREQQRVQKTASERDQQRQAVKAAQKQVADLEKSISLIKDDNERQIQELRAKKCEEIEKLHDRVKITVAKKDKRISLLKEQLEQCNVRTNQLEVLLEKQRDELIQ